MILDLTIKFSDEEDNIFHYQFGEGFMVQNKAAHRQYKQINLEAIKINKIIELKEELKNSCQLLLNNIKE